MINDDLRIRRLAVTLTRDGGWKGVGSNAIRDVLLYIGAPREYVDQRVGSFPINIDFLTHDYGDPRTVIGFLDELIDMELLAQFLTELLRTSFSPKNQKDFRAHLQPLGYDWDEKHNQIRPTATHPEVQIAVRNELEELLSGIDLEFPKMLNGAWEAFYSNSADRYRQTIASCRELLNQTIRKLSNGEKLRRKERVRRILGSKSRAKVIEASASLVDALYAVQSGAQHTKSDSSTALFVLIETEHILYYMLKKSSRASTSGPK